MNAYDVLVIGAGQAGLAMGYHLRQARLRFLIVDQCERVGDRWRQRYDTLVPFTPVLFKRPARPALPRRS